jgi:Fic family protein
MADMCDHIRENWDKQDLIQLAVYTMWRINWIHPFENGNGRTSRAVSYLVLGAKYGGVLPAKQSVIQQIIGNKAPYNLALRTCDEEFAKTSDISALRLLEELLTALLKAQLRASLS